jgi:putative copper export protein
MLVKAVILFLGAMVLLGMVGNWLFPGAIKRSVQRRVGPVKCPKCGRFLMGRSVCDCKRKG